MTLASQQLATSKRRRARLVKICQSLPEVSVAAVGDGHLAFRIRKRVFGYYSFDHHGDGLIAFCCKSSRSEQSRMVREDPVSFFVPAYLGSRGWIAIRLDLNEVDWETVSELARRAYQDLAPRKLASAID